MAINLSFPDITYSSSNKPSAVTLKADLATIETDHNAHLVDATLHFLASTVWPIGSVYTAVVATNPGTLLGFGTWSAFAAGRVLVGIDAGQTEFDVVEETGGAKTHTLTTAEMPVHTHIQDAHFHTIGMQASDQDGSSSNGSVSGSSNTSSVTATNQNTGSGSAHNNLQPYIVVYMWKRTA